MVLPDRDVQFPQTTSDGSPTSESARQTSPQVVKSGRHEVSMMVVIADAPYQYMSLNTPTDIYTYKTMEGNDIDVTFPS